MKSDNIVIHLIAMVILAAGYLVKLSESDSQQFTFHHD